MKPITNPRRLLSEYPMDNPKKYCHYLKTFYKQNKKVKTKVQL